MGDSESPDEPESATEDAVKALINAAVELCLLRIGPQQLPGAPALFVLLLLLDLLLGILVSTAMGIGFGPGLLESLFQLALMLLTLYLALKLARKPNRFQQTASALLLSELLINLLALPLVGWYQRSHSLEAGFLLIVTVFWSIVVAGHILRHSFNLELNIGIAVAVFYFLVSLNLTSLLFPVPA